MPQWLRKSEKTQIFLSVCRAQEATLSSCTRCRDTPAGRLGGALSQQLSCTMSSQPFSTDRRETAYGDLHHQLLVSITLKQGFSKAKGFQLHPTSPPRAAARHKDGPFASGFHPFLSQSYLAVGHCELMHPTREEAAFHPCAQGLHCKDQLPKNSKAVREQMPEMQGCPGKGSGRYRQLLRVTPMKRAACWDWQTAASTLASSRLSQHDDNLFVHFEFMSFKGWPKS